MYQNRDLDHIVYLQIALSRPLDATKIADGWTEESRLELLNTLSALKTSLRYSTRIPPLMLSSFLDRWGIICGDLYESIKRFETTYEGGAVPGNERRHS